MSTDIQQVSDAAEQMRLIQKRMAAVSALARHKKEMAEQEFLKVDQAYQDGNLPAELEALWERHRQTLIEAGSRAEAFANNWDSDFPVIAADKAEAP